MGLGTQGALKHQGTERLGGGKMILQKYDRERGGEGGNGLGDKGEGQGDKRWEGGSKRKEPELEDNTEPESGMEDAIPQWLTIILQ